MSTERISRREFTSRALRAGLAASVMTAGPLARKVAANERITMGLIGCGGMGLGNMDDLIRTGEVQMVAVCDVDRTRCEQAARHAGGDVAQYRDFREMLARDDIDAVIVATPDHWHALPTILACEAGKDVYVEKPLSLTLYEGRRMVEAARRYSRVVQTGTQQRSGRHFQEAVEIVASGRLGKVSFVRCFNYENEHPHGIGNPPDSEPPEGLDWDLWLGPARRVPYNKNRCFYNFRWFWDYSGGKLTDWGVHLIDIAQWAMGVDAPLSASAFGHKYYLEDNRETPDTLHVMYEYPGFLLVYENRVVNDDRLNGHGYGVEFHGTDGTLFVDRGGYELRPQFRNGVPRTEPLQSGGSDQHFTHCRNFVECVRSRQRPQSDVEICHRSTSTPHLGNISLKVGRTIRWDAAREQIIGDDEANALLRPRYREPWRLV